MLTWISQLQTTTILYMTLQSYSGDTIGDYKRSLCVFPSKSEKDKNINHNKNLYSYLTM